MSTDVPAEEVRAALAAEKAEEDRKVFIRLLDEYPSGYRIRYEDGRYQADIPHARHVEAGSAIELERKIGEARARSLGRPR